MTAVCTRCNASGDDPCRTITGKVATSEHVGRSRVVRSPRHLEAAIVKSADDAYWLTPIDTPTIDLALIIGRKIDDQIWTAEHVAVGTLFEDAALGRLEGTIVYDVQTLHTVLTSLGLNAKGRTELRLPDHGNEADDEVVKIIALYGDE